MLPWERGVGDEPRYYTTANWLHETFKQSSDTIFQETDKINYGTLLFKLARTDSENMPLMI